MRVERENIVRPQTAALVEEAVNGSTLLTVERRGKNILLHLAGGAALHVHLRMTGNLYVVPDVRFRPASTRAWFELEGGRGLLFDDPRALGRIRLYQPHEMQSILGDVGIEPLSDAFTFDYLRDAAARTHKPAKLFLMDQRHIAGLGNIYAAEALFRARIHPAKPMSKIRRPKLAALHSAIREILEEAVGSAEAAYSVPGRFQEAESFECSVYDREDEPCLVCSRKIRRISQGGRSTYFCGTCQR
jgi:formamidopyrimidine-DNA glycosylase